MNKNLSTRPIQFMYLKNRKIKGEDYAIIIQMYKLKSPVAAAAAVN